MCTFVMDPSHGTLDIFHFEEVIYIFSNIFEVPVGLVILKLKYLLLLFTAEPLVIFYLAREPSLDGN